MLIYGTIYCLCMSAANSKCRLSNMCLLNDCRIKFKYHKARLQSHSPPKTTKGLRPTTLAWKIFKHIRHKRYYKNVHYDSGRACFYVHLAKENRRFVLFLYKRGAKDTKGTVKLINRK